MKRAATKAFLSGLVIFFLANCDKPARYRLEWRFEDTEITSASDCSARGVESLRISVLKGGRAVKSHTARCHPPERTSPKLSPGTYELVVEGLGYDGEPIRDPNTGEQLVVTTATEVKVSRGKITPVAVTLTRPPRCLDGVDNDGDGLVDALDPGCWLTGDKGYLILDEEGRHTYVPRDDDESDPEDPPTNGTLEVTWTVLSETDGCPLAGPDGAQWVVVSLDGAPEVSHPCADGAAAFTVPPGPIHLDAYLTDDQGWSLTRSTTADATAEAGLSVPVHLDFLREDLYRAQLQFNVSWETAGGGCSDASPMVSELAALVVDPVTDATVTGVMLPHGTPVDGSSESYGICLDPSETFSVFPSLPVGRYRVTIWGRPAAGPYGWSKTFEDLGVGPSVTDPWPLVVDRTSTAGTCAP